MNTSRTIILAVVLGALWPLAASWAATKPVCLVKVPGSQTNEIDGVLTVDGDSLFYGDGLYLVHNNLISSILTDNDGDDVPVFDAKFVSEGVLLLTSEGLFLFSNGKLTSVESPHSKLAPSMQTIPDGAIIGADNGLFLFQDGQIRDISLPNMGKVNVYQAYDGGYLLGGNAGQNPGRGLFLYRAGRVEPVPDADIGPIFDLHRIHSGVLVSAAKGIYLYNQGRIDAVNSSSNAIANVASTSKDTLVVLNSEKKPSLFQLLGLSLTEIPNIDMTGVYSNPLLVVQGGILVGSKDGTFLFADGHLDAVNGPPTGAVADLTPVPEGIIVSAANGTFLFADGKLVSIAAVKTKGFFEALDTGMGTLLGDADALYLLSNGRISPFPGGRIGGVDDSMGQSAAYPADYYVSKDANGVWIGGYDGIFRLIVDPLDSPGSISLENARSLEGARVYAQGITLVWKFHHPCASLADQLNIRVSAQGPSGEDKGKVPAVIMSKDEGEASFETTIPIASPGSWSFRAIAEIAGEELPLGSTREGVTFVGTGFGWITFWLQRTSLIGAILLVILNVVLFILSRYSPWAWSVVTDDDWLRAPIRMPMLFLRHWQLAQLWILDLYVSRSRRVLPYPQTLYFPLPLTAPDGTIVAAESVLSTLKARRRVWIQGGPGMGKTTIFRHLTQTAFVGPAADSFAIYGRDGYILVPIEARRFADLEGKDTSTIGLGRGVHTERTQPANVTLR